MMATKGEKPVAPTSNSVPEKQSLPPVPGLVTTVQQKIHFSRSGAGVRGKAVQRRRRPPSAINTSGESLPKDGKAANTMNGYQFTFDPGVLASEHGMLSRDSGISARSQTSSEACSMASSRDQTSEGDSGLQPFESVTNQLKELALQAEDYCSLDESPDEDVFSGHGDVTGSGMAKAKMRKLFAFQYMTPSTVHMDETYSGSLSVSGLSHDDSSSVTGGRDPFSPNLDLSLQNLSDTATASEADVNPKALQERLDRAIHIARKFKYKYKREKAEREKILVDVQKCEKKCVEQVDIMAQNFFGKIYELKKRLRTSESERRELARVHDDLLKENEYLRKNFNSNVHMTNTSLQQLQADLHRAMLDSQRHAERAADLHKKNRQVTQTKQKLEAELRHSLSEIQSHRAVINTLIQTNNQLLDTKRKLEENLHLVYADAQLHNQRADSFVGQNEQMMRTTQQCLEEAQYLKDRTSTLTEMNKKLISAKQHLEKTLQEMKLNMHEQVMNKSDDDKQREIARLRGEINKLQAQERDLRHVIDTLTRERDELRNQLKAHLDTLQNGGPPASALPPGASAPAPAVRLGAGQVMVTCEHGCHDLQTGRRLRQVEGVTCKMESTSDAPEDFSVTSGGNLSSDRLIMENIRLKKAVSSMKGKLKALTNDLDSQKSTNRTVIQEFDQFRATYPNSRGGLREPEAPRIPSPSRRPMSPPRNSGHPASPTGSSQTSGDLGLVNTKPDHAENGWAAAARPGSPDRRRPESRGKSFDASALPPQLKHWGVSYSPDSRLSHGQLKKRNGLPEGRSSVPVPLHGGDKHHRRKHNNLDHIAACTESILNQMDLAVAEAGRTFRKPLNDSGDTEGDNTAKKPIKEELKPLTRRSASCSPSPADTRLRHVSLV